MFLTTSNVLDYKCTLVPSQNHPKQNAFFPAPSYFKLLKLPSTALPADSSSLLVISKQKKENEETRQKRHDQMYKDAEERRPIRIGETKMIMFMRHSKYLRSYISYSLKDD